MGIVRVVWWCVCVNWEPLSVVGDECSHVTVCPPVRVSIVGIKVTTRRALARWSWCCILSLLAHHFVSACLDLKFLITSCSHLHCLDIVGLSPLTLSQFRSFLLSIFKSRRCSCLAHSLCSCWSGLPQCLLSLSLIALSS